MNRFPKLAVFVVFCALAAGPASAREDDNRLDVVVRIKAGVSILELVSDYGTTVNDRTDATDVYSLLVPRGLSEESFIEALRADSRVVYVDDDEWVASPEFNGDPMHLPFDRNVKSAKYLAQPAYKQVRADLLPSAASGEGVIVAVLDTGVDLTHPALAGHLVPGYNAITPGSAPLDAPDGYLNYVAGHGTMVAGLIARLAPKAKIMPIRVLNGDGIGRVMAIAKGIDYALSHGARVVNMSFGSPATSDVLNDVIDACEKAGVICVAAVGNQGLEARQYPAAGGYVLSVASVNGNGRKSPYSNFGRYVRLCAPGTAIRSTFPGGAYATWSGTSFATPFVSAGAALVLSAHPSWKGEKVTEALMSTACMVDTLNPTFLGKLGHGIVDLEKAVKFED